MTSRVWNTLSLLGVTLCFLVPAAHCQDTNFYKVVPVNNLQLAPLIGALQGPLSDFVPAGIENIVGLQLQSAILVRARDQASLDQFAALISGLDQPVKQVRVELTLVDMGSAAGSALAGQVQFAQTPISVSAGAAPGVATTQLRYGQGSLSAGLGALTAGHTSSVMSSPSLLVPSGGSGTFALGDPSLPLQGLHLDQVNVAPDNSVTMNITPLFGAYGMYADLPPVRVMDGESIVVAGLQSGSSTSDTGPGGAATAAGGRNMMLIVTPHVMIPDTTDFGAMQMPAPLW